MTRTAVVWLPDWPLVAAGASQIPSAIVHANRVVVCSAPARSQGVRRGLRKREAQARCPSLEIVPEDQARDARSFEPVVRAIEDLCPQVEIVRPGVCAMRAQGPSYYFGGEEPFARKLAGAVEAEARVGIADGFFAASLAARRSEIVAPGETASFLAPFPVGTLDLAELAGVLARLGIRTLGAFAELPAKRVLERFGTEAWEAHRLARGIDPRPLAPRTLPPELTVEANLDPPAERVDHAAFVAKSLAGELHERLHREGLACTRIRIEAETEHGESMSRLWRHDGGLDASGVAQRVRWQLDGWISNGTDRPTGAVSLIRLVPDEVKPNRGRQRGFWGSETEADERAARAMARVQAMLGPEGVFTAVLSGGRGHAEQATLVRWGEPREPARPGSPGDDQMKISGWHRSELPPWPGRLQGPSPSVVHSDPAAARVTDATGLPVTVGGRGITSAPPARVTFGGRAHEVKAWSTAWPADERWWDASARRRRARLQVLLDSGAHLLALEDGVWRLEASWS